MNLNALAVTMLLVVSSVGPAAVGAAGATGAAPGIQDSNAYTGTHVEFRTTGDAIANYSVNGETVLETVAVQSTSAAESGGLGVGIDLSAVTSFQAAGLTLQSGASASTQATVQSQSGATVQAHDNERGVMVVRAGGESQYVRANLSGESNASQSGDKRVVVTKESGQSGAFLVVGDGQVTVNDAGNVSAKLSENARLVYRQYDGERSQSDQEQERLITSGAAVAEIYYQQAQDSGGDSQQRVADVVNYSEDTTVEITERSANRLNATVERAQSQGKVVIVSVSDAAMENAENLEVYVDGEAAAEASSYSEVESATQGGDNSAYLVESSSNAEASTDVVVGINHFSTREMSIQSDEGDGGGSGVGQPGFGVIAALVALAGVGLLARSGL